MTDRVKEIRDLLAQADRHKKIAHVADMARVSIRLGRDAKVERRRTFKVDTKVFTAYETNALYEALGIVMRDHEALAKECEKKATDG